MPRRQSARNQSPTGSDFDSGSSSDSASGKDDEGSGFVVEKIIDSRQRHGKVKTNKILNYTTTKHKIEKYNQKLNFYVYLWKFKTIIECVLCLFD